MVLLTALEDAQVRVATAQEVRDKLHLEILRKFESISYLDKTCRFANLAIRKDKDAVELRRAYHKAQKELRLAKSDLARMRSGEQQELKEYEVGIREDRDGITLTNVPDELAGDLTGGTGRVIGQTPDGEGMIIELDHAKPEHMRAMDEAAERVERKGQQMDLEGNPAPEVETGSETKEYLIYATESYRIKISEESLDKILEKKDREVLAWVQGHMRLLDPKRPVDPGVYDRDAKALYSKLRRAP